MKVSESWLREWVNPALTAQELAAQLTMAGLEVDAVNPVAGDFTNVVVAEVVSTEPHPQADKLTICRVNTNEGAPCTVVCGASNVRRGLKVALAKLGATLPGGFKIKEVKLRGQLSQGMLCSASELALEESSEGIMELPEDAPVGMDIREYMTLNDHILDIDLTPNRADCFSILGVAREAAALNHLTLTSIPAKTIPAQIEQSLPIDAKAPNACPQYYGRVIKDINPHAVTPLWLKERLRRGGIRSLHPVVDVTNYVMLELGQPMHAFDLDALDKAIEIRYAREGETLMLLDGQEVELSPAVLLIADKSKPLAMAGIMGGESSAVHPQTTNLFLESAYFNPVAIAGVARQYGLCTDSSQRFERGVDPALQRIAMERATELLQDIVGGQAGPLTSFNEPNALPPAVDITFNPNRVEQLTGVQLSDTEMKAILNHLGMQVDSKEPLWKVRVPSHRFDIALEVDLIEEIIRLNGYDAISAQPMMIQAEAGVENQTEQMITRVSRFLSHRGYHETISYSFVDPELQAILYPESSTLKLLNPISQELSEMRAGMWPGLIASMIYNLHRQQTAIKLFEAGVVFDMESGELKEQPCIAGLLVGEKGALNWSEQTRPFDLFDLKGDLEALFDHLNIDCLEFRAKKHPALHPGKAAGIYLNQNQVGWLGVLHPKIVDELDFNGEVLLFELKINVLTQPSPIHYQSISKYPQIRRDLSLLVDASIPVSDIEKTIQSVVNATWLKGFDVFDVYTGVNIPKGKKSVAIALTLQDATRTLVDSEINAVISAIIKSLEEQFEIILRD
ncbi:phenylalanine--tRNA ligase subunit beta [Legionella impletisoli]|uniref:Phenylalanine--tRNA ligase beta subunit n=1 Tax=Legionella impletisoli TaxID=343510 RepID=A0A917JTE5_9GAMM|nr:phenylalanine--tRNA ligase subunit beta [Legionella impletisoli]GGI83214.1 phenylalanine--tRNA ligase beta subunit [Legionella impletisoli]